MPDIKSSIKLAIAGGPAWSIDHAQTVDAYDVLDLILEPGSVDAEIQLQPGSAGQVAVLAIQSSLYGEEISLKASDGDDDSPSVQLLGPQLYGNGNVGLFTVAPHLLKLTNGHPAADPSKRARIRILVGRAAIAP